MCFFFYIFVQVYEVRADCDMQEELETRWRQLESRLDNFTTDTEGVSTNSMRPQCINCCLLSVFFFCNIFSILCFVQISKTLEEARSVMLAFIGDEDLGAVQDHTASQAQEPSLAKRRASLQETESAYFSVSLLKCVSNDLFFLFAFFGR